MADAEHFLRPSYIESLLNKMVGVLARWGFGPGYIYLLEVRGRKTGKLYTTPVNLHPFGNKQYLVGGRGHTAWSRNAGAGGEVTLRRGSSEARYKTVPVSDEDKPPILKSYLDTYAKTVQRFFEVPAGSSVEAFRRIGDRHPVFELIRKESR
jgi:deazaflavin-dependent oxidoreductase (nitroreductase family)